MNGSHTASVELQDPSQVSAARMRVQGMARALGFDETRTSGAAIAVTEAATNVLRHGGGGVIFARPVARAGSLGVELLAVDNGRGMESFHASSRDGYSTAGSAGTGLGAMQRMADEFDVYTRPEGGTVVRMVFWDRKPGPDDAAYEVGVVSLPKRGEDVNGDAFAAELDEEGAAFMVADGLGHGPDATRAATLALNALAQRSRDSATRIMQDAHERLRPTRGAALAVARHNRAADYLTFAGVGNISASVWNSVTSERHAMVSQNGIVGHNLPNVHENRYAWPVGTFFIAHSDGLETRWDAGAFPGLAACPASIIAAVLHRAHSRQRDDALVLVVRRRR